MRDKLINTAIAATIILVAASIYVLWGEFWVIAIIVLVGLGVAAAVVGVLKGYELYVGIQARSTGYSSRWESSQQRVPGKHPDTRASVQQSLSSMANSVDGKWAAPSFHQLIKSGVISAGQEMIAGYRIEDGEPVILPLLRTMGIGGVTGSGKTVTTLNTILSQIVFTGGNIRYLVVDPHMFGETGEDLVTMMDSLYPFFLSLEEVRASVSPGNHGYLAQLEHMEKLAIGNPLEGGAALLEWVKILHFEMEDRLHGKKGPQWVVVIDEFSSVMRHKEIATKLAAILETIGEEARKFRIALLLIGQVWKSTRTGGTELRDVLPEFKAHRMPINWAKLVVPDDVARRVPKLQTGQAIVYHDGHDDLVSIPMTTQADAVKVARLYHKPANMVIVEEVADVRYLEPPR